MIGLFFSQSSSSVVFAPSFTGFSLVELKGFVSVMLVFFRSQETNLAVFEGSALIKLLRMLESNFAYPYIPLVIVLARPDGCRS